MEHLDYSPDFPYIPTEELHRLSHESTTAYLFVSRFPSNMVLRHEQGA
jgi:hypothetical protein